MTRGPGGDTGCAWRDGLAAAVFAGVVSGIPSTAHAVLTGRDPLAATWAAGRIVAGRAPRGLALVAAAGAVHAALSVGWATVLAAGLPRRHPAVWGAGAGLAIAALDLGVVGRRIPAVRELPTAPQVADHVAFGLAVGWVVGRRRAHRSVRWAARPRR